jgi:uncharacterized membrane protein
MKLTEIKNKFINDFKRGDLTDKAFHLGILFKGIDAILEIIGGFLLLTINPVTLNQLIIFLTQRELSEDPKDLIANQLFRLAQTLSLDSLFFGAFYLLSHGIIKLLLIGGLWKRKVNAYPAAMIFFLMFIVYQLYRYSMTRSFWLIALSIFDTLVIYLIWAEYRRIRKNNACVNQ